MDPLSAFGFGFAAGALVTLGICLYAAWRVWGRNPAPEGE